MNDDNMEICKKNVDLKGINDHKASLASSST